MEFALVLWFRVQIRGFRRGGFRQRERDATGKSSATAQFRLERKLASQSPGQLASNGETKPRALFIALFYLG